MICEKCFAATVLVFIVATTLLPALGVAEGVETSVNTSGDSSPKLEEIVVTATKREQTLDEVPLSVAVLTKAEMDTEGVRDLTDIARLTPGLSVQSTGLDNSISIRGIYSSVGAATTGVYIDDTPVQIRSNPLRTTGTALPEVFDLDRVEVLRGPQGTLFGAGSEGGTVRYITPQPSLTAFSTYFRTEVSGTEHGAPSYEIGAAEGGPILNNELGFRVSAWVRDDGGYILHKGYLPGGLDDEHANGEQAAVVRAAVTAAPNETLTITPALFFQRLHYDDNPTFNLGFGNPGDGHFVNQNILLEPSSDSFYLPSLKIQQAAGAVNLTSITSYFYNDNPNYFDYTEVIRALLGASPYPTSNDANALTYVRALQNVFTEEFRVQTADPSARLVGTVGAFYTASRLAVHENALQPGLGNLTEQLFGATPEEIFGIGLLPGGYVFDGRTTSHDDQLAVFGQADYHFTRALDLTIGLRAERTSYDYQEVQDGPFAGGHQVQSGSKTEKPVTPKFGLSYQANQNSLFYGTISEGYRVGGANTPIATTPGCTTELHELGLNGPPATFDSDTTWNYEIGAKNQLFDNRLDFQASVFRINWRNIQQQVYLPDCGQGFISNLGSARSDGFDLAAKTQITQHLVLSGSVGYTDVKYESTVASGGLIIVHSGDAINSSQSPWDLSAALDYTFTMFNQASYFHVDDEYHSHNPGPFAFQQSDTLSYDPTLSADPHTNQLNLRFGVDISGWDASLFVDNALNAHPVLEVVHQTPSSPLFSAVTIRPLTAGLTVIRRF